MSAILTPDTTVRPATPADIPFVLDLAKKWSYEVGFLPKVAYENRIAGRRGGGVLLADVNGQEASFLHYGSLRSRECRVFQIATAMDLRRRHVGMNLIEQLIGTCEAGDVQLVTCRCLESIDAVHFWEALGFRRTGYERGQRGLLGVWQYRTTHWWDAMLGGKPAISGNRRTHDCPDCGEQTTDTWTAGAKRWATCPACTNKRLSGPQE